MILGSFALLLLILYPVPTLIAFARRKTNKVAITVLNIFAGWTFIGWVIALVWSLMNEKTEVKRVA
ncbi:superinfection immunity protein [Halalkalibacter okhensis]|uniref:superinfection immunity protein n=1 Tax=Halalkalibacter okhensis TaxID=333138 RepID=UPI000B24311E|nr:superinfection immunity protein [Halalkalibacter okhensis]